MLVETLCTQAVCPVCRHKQPAEFPPLTNRLASKSHSASKSTEVHTVLLREGPVPPSNIWIQRMVVHTVSCEKNKSLPALPPWPNYLIFLSLHCIIHEMERQVWSTSLRGLYEDQVWSNLLEKASGSVQHHTHRGTVHPPLLRLVLTRRWGRSVGSIAPNLSPPLAGSALQSPDC